MAAITDISDLVNRMSGGNSGAPETIFWHRKYHVAGTAVAWTAGKWYSMWQLDGSPGPGAAPGAVAVPTNATAGGLMQTDPSGVREKWLIQNMAVGYGDSSLVVLYDRLLHVGGLSGTSVAAQNVQNASAVVLTRNTGGVGNQIWVEIYSAIGATPQTITASYTNQSGTAGRTTTAVAIGGSGLSEVTTMIQLPLQANDTGVQAVSTVTLSGSTGTAGDFGVNIVRPLSWNATSLNGVPSSRDFTIGMPGMPKIDTDACLAMQYLAKDTGEGSFMGALSFVES